MVPEARWYHRDRPKRVTVDVTYIHFNISECVPQQCFSIDNSYQDALLLCNSPFITFSTIHVLDRMGGKGRGRLLGKIVLLVAKLHAHCSIVYCQDSFA